MNPRPTGPDSSRQATSRSHHQRLGDYGEQCAARFLTSEKGMVVLDRNWRCSAGEIDLVLRDGNVLVVCEVKTRSSERYGSTLEAVDSAKAQRLHSLAALWCEARALPLRRIRVDVVGVLVSAGAVERIDHIAAVG